MENDFDIDDYVFNTEETQLSLQETSTSSDDIFWKDAINDEMNSLVFNNTWKLVESPPGCTTIGCKLVLRNKYKLNGTINKFKAWLVTKGVKQKADIDFFNTFLR